MSGIKNKKDFINYINIRYNRNVSILVNDTGVCNKKVEFRLEEDYIEFCGTKVRYYYYEDELYTVLDERYKDFLNEQSSSSSDRLLQRIGKRNSRVNYTDASIFKLVSYSYCSAMDYFDQPGFEENSYHVEDGPLADEGAYFIRKSWIDKLE